MSGHSDPAPAMMIGLGLGLWTFFKGFRVVREDRLLQDTPRIPIRSVAMGFAHIRGKAESSETLSSPVSQIPCCFYKVEIDEWKSQGKNRNWVRVCSDLNGYQFYLADDTGKILIDAHSAEYDLPMAATRVVDSGSPQETDCDRLLQYVNLAQRHSMTNHLGDWIDKRFEKAGAADDPEIEAKREAFRELFTGISALGQGGKPPIAAVETIFNAAEPIGDPDQERRQLILQNLKTAEAVGEGTLLSQLLPGTVSSAEGRYRLREYLIVPGEEYLVSGTCLENCDLKTKDQDRSMIAKGKNEATFVISTKSDSEVHRAFEKRAFLMIFGGAVLAIAAAAGLLVHFGLF